MRLKSITAIIVVLCSTFISCLDDHQEPIDLSLKVGNIYCEDGRIYPVDYFLEQNAAPAGIITAVGGPNDNYRALVMALEDIGSTYYLNSVEEKIGNVSSDITLFNGKENTAALLVASLDSDSIVQLKPAGAILCSSYKASGKGAWHLPSVAEFRSVANSYAAIVSSLKAIGADKLQQRYQTSTVDGSSEDNEQLFNYTIELPKGNISSTLKTESHPVRAFMILR